MSLYVRVLRPVCASIDVLLYPWRSFPIVSWSSPGRLLVVSGLTVPAVETKGLVVYREEGCDAGRPPAADDASYAPWWASV
jgi:hypothetical protein